MLTQLTDLSDLAGKTIKRVVEPRATSDYSVLLLTFTDGSFVRIKADRAWDEGAQISWTEGLSDDHERVAIGLITREEQAERARAAEADRQRAALESDRRTYERLKAKFEGKG